MKAKAICLSLLLAFSLPVFSAKNSDTTEYDLSENGIIQEEVLFHEARLLLFHIKGYMELEQNSGRKIKYSFIPNKPCAIDAEDCMIHLEGLSEKEANQVLARIGSPYIRYIADDGNFILVKDKLLRAYQYSMTSMFHGKRSPHSLLISLREFMKKEENEPIKRKQNILRRFLLKQLDYLEVRPHESEKLSILMEGRKLIPSQSWFMDDDGDCFTVLFVNSQISNGPIPIVYSATCSGLRGGINDIRPESLFRRERVVYISNSSRDKAFPSGKILNARFIKDRLLKVVNIQIDQTHISKSYLSSWFNADFYQETGMIIFDENGNPFFNF